MRVVRLLLVIAVLSLLALAQNASSPNDSRLTIVYNVDNGFSLEPYSASGESMFPKTFQRMEFAPLQPFSMILRNSSEKDIVGLTLRWTIVDSAGHKEIMDYSTDSLFLVRRPVLAGGGRLLIMPGVLIPQGNDAHGFIGPGKETMEAISTKFTGTSKVSVSVDFLMFDDGTIVGPDLSSTLARIIARKEAAQQILSAVRQGADLGKDRNAVLDELGALKVVGPTDYTGQWRARIVANLRHAPSPAFDIDGLSRMPDPPIASRRGEASQPAGATPQKTGPRLVSWKCSPASCIDEHAYVYSGIAHVTINGICNNGFRPSATGQVAAYCTLPVTLVATGYPDIYTYGYDLVTGTARAYNVYGIEYWFMYNDDGCDGHYYFFADPPTSC